MSWAVTAGKREREARRDRRKKEKQERLQRNRMMGAQGREQAPALLPQQLPEVKLEDVVIGVAPQARRNTSGPVKLFVGGLSWNTTAEDLRGVFGNFGAIEDVTVPMDRGTGRSRGFGFVTFTKPEDATEAAARMNGATLDGRSLKVNNAESR
jgi:RNA recognition motif-containing protein